MKSDRWDEAGNPIFVCPLCDSDHGGDLSSIANRYLYGLDLSPDHPAGQICEACADIVSNLVCLRTTGKPLTWDNFARAPASGYAKKPIPEALRWEIFNRDGLKCLKCGSTSFLRVDHIHPERLGGPMVPGNLQTLCRSCNSRKGARV